MFSHEDFDNLNREIQKISPENSDFSNFNLYALSIAELIYLSRLENEEERYRFFLSVMNVFFMSTDGIEDTNKIMDYICDMILALSLHLCISVQSISEKTDYIKMLNENIIPDISNKLRDL